MVELLLHFTIPFAALAYLRRPKYALIASFFALLPDLDALMFIHRSITHSLIVILTLAIPIIFLVKRFKPKFLTLALMCLFALTSHPLLDLFQAPTPILWPLTTQSMELNVFGNVIISNSPSLNLNLGFNLVKTDFKPFKMLDAPIFTSEGLVISIVLLLPQLTSCLRKLFKGYKYK